MASETENEFKTLMPGLTDKLRTGFVTAIIAIQFCAIVYLFILMNKLQDQKADMQAKLYEKVIDYIKPTKDKMEQSAKKVDTVVDKAQASLELSDSVNNYLLENKKPK